MAPNRRDVLLTGSSAAAATLVATGPVPAQAAEQPTAAPGVTGGTSLPTSEQTLKIVTLRDLEAEAEQVMTPAGFAYVSGGAGDEWTMRENLAAFNRWVILPDYLSGHRVPNTSTTLLGTRIPSPVITAAMGNQGVVHALMETPVVEGTAMAGTIFVESSVSQMSLEAVAAASSGPKWFQIYVPESRPFAIEMLHRAKAAGYTAIVVTADAFVFSNRERNTRLVGQSMPTLPMGNAPLTPGMVGSAMAMKADLNWDDIEFCRRETGLPVIVKSILLPSQAREAVRRGCSAVWLSNHGGRQLDNVPSAMTMLPRVVDALQGALPVIVDGGVYRGQDVFRALALGASAVALGRPLLYGSALGGTQGVQSVHAHLQTELVMAMQLAGTPTIKSITRDFVARSEADG